MSKQRIIKDEMWSDEWFYELDPSEKLMWVFLLTNPRNNIAGIYKVNNSWIGNHTGFEKNVVEMILNRFIKDNKIKIKDKWIVIINHHKHQSSNPKVEQGIYRIISKLPISIRKILDYDSLCIAYPTLLNLTLLNLAEEKEKITPSSKKEKKPLPYEKTLEYLNNIPPEDITSFKGKYDVNIREIKQKADSLYNYCISKDKKYKNYKMFLMGTLNKDFGLK